jgi:putative oxidoreductase
LKEVIAVDTGLLLLRVLIGLLLAAHGAQKLFGWFSGHGLRGTADFLESLGWRPAAHSRSCSAPPKWQAA